jgi:hypothetical protein
MCQDGSIEDVPHFLTGCKALHTHRQRLLEVLKSRLPSLGAPGRFLLNEFRSSADTRVKLILASEVNFPRCQPHEAEWRYHRQCAMALWSLDKATKNYIAAAWRHRRSVLGTMRLSRTGGKPTLVRSPPTETRAVGACKGPSANEDAPYHLRKHWSTWLAHVKSRQQGGKSNRKSQGHKGRWNFYNVWRGKKVGVFYKWSDCLESMNGHPDPSVKGFDSLSAAYAHSEVRGPRAATFATRAG